MQRKRRKGKSQVNVSFWSKGWNVSPSKLISLLFRSLLFRHKICTIIYHFLWEFYIVRDLVLRYVHVSLQMLLLIDTFSKKCKYVKYESWQSSRQRQEFLMLVYAGVRLATWSEVMRPQVARWQDGLIECKTVSYKVIWSRIETHSLLSWRWLQHLPSEVSYKPIKLGGVKPRNYSVPNTWIINVNSSCFFSAGRSPAGSGCLWPVSKNQLFVCCIRHCLRGLCFMCSSGGLLSLRIVTDARTMK